MPALRVSIRDLPNLLLRPLGSSASTWTLARSPCTSLTARSRLRRSLSARVQVGFDLQEKAEHAVADGSPPYCFGCWHVLRAPYSLSGGLPTVLDDLGVLIEPAARVGQFVEVRPAAEFIVIEDTEGAGNRRSRAISASSSSSEK